ARSAPTTLARGAAMHARSPRSVPLTVEELEGRYAPTTAPWTLETFENLGNNASPAGWVRWTGSGGGTFASAVGSGLGSDTGFVSNGTSIDASRAWMSTPFDADVQVRAALQVNSLVPGQVFVRGQNLNTDKPNYYAVSVTRGMEVQLLRVVNGKTTVLGSVKSAAWFGG